MSSDDDLKSLVAEAVDWLDATVEDLGCIHGDAPNAGAQMTACFDECEFCLHRWAAAHVRDKLREALA